MIKLKWICTDCETIQVYEDSKNEPLDISEFIELTCTKCKSKFELVINRNLERKIYNA